MSDDHMDGLAYLAESLTALMDRRDFVCKHVPHCPKCREQMQIQVTDWQSVPAKWRCRKCKHRYEYEPLTAV